MDWLNQWLPIEWQAVGLIDVVVLFFAGAVVDFLQRRLLARVVARTRSSPNFWDDALIEALRAPLSLLIWVVVITMSLEIAGQGVDRGIATKISELRSIGVVVVFTWIFLRWINNVRAGLLERPQLFGHSISKANIDAMHRLSMLAISIIGVITVLESLGFDLTALLAAGGIGGVVLGFASRDVVANFFGGLMIFATRPFREGDWIRSPDREIEGTVEEVGWYSTIIRTFESRPLYVPNSIFTGIALENSSRMKNRRIRETIGVRYDDFARIEPIVADVDKMLRAHPEIEAEQQMLMVNFSAFGASSLDFFVYCFTKTNDWAKFHAVKQDVLRRIGEIVTQHGAEIAFPTHTVHLPEALPQAALARAHTGE